MKNMIDLEPLKLECEFEAPDYLEIKLFQYQNEVEFRLIERKKAYATYHNKDQIQELIKYLTEVVEYMK